MAWKRVVNYSFGFGVAAKKFWVYYEIEGTGVATQLFLTAAQFEALAAMFGAATAINYETTGNYFATAARTL